MEAGEAFEILEALTLPQAFRLGSGPTIRIESAPGPAPEDSLVHSMPSQISFTRGLKPGGPRMVIPRLKEVVLRSKLRHVDMAALLKRDFFGMKVKLVGTNEDWPKHVSELEQPQRLIDGL